MTAPAPTAVEAAKADSVAAYLRYRDHIETCWKCFGQGECVNRRALDDVADIAYARYRRELAKGLAA